MNSSLGVITPRTRIPIIFEVGGILQCISLPGSRFLPNQEDKVILEIGRGGGILFGSR